MWIKKSAFQEWVKSVRALEQYVAYLSKQLDEQKLQRLALEDKLEAAQAGMAAAQVSEARAKAYTDTFRVRVNELTYERAALLQKVVPGLKLVTPRIEHSPIVDAPGISFEDMGDAAAQMHGLGDTIPQAPADRVGVGVGRTEPPPDFLERVAEPMRDDEFDPTGQNGPQPFTPFAHEG